MLPPMRRVGLFGLAIGLSLSAEAENTHPDDCAPCHEEIHRRYLRHGMSRSLGPVKKAPTGRATNEKTGWRYRLIREGQHSLLQATGPDGGRRLQRIVGRIGAGQFDTSWVTAELDPVTREPINRLFFAPVETITGHGLELSPFEHSERPAGVNMPLTRDCLICHSDTAVEKLPKASKNNGQVHPANALGVNAFSHLEPLGCEACHGSARRHLRRVTGMERGDEIGLTVLSSRPPAERRDVCARCHLQGDVRFQLVAGRPAAERPLVAQMPTLIPSRPTDDFRFVGQLERLGWSKCFQKSPSMTCTTCHDPHTSVSDQGVAAFENACLTCHAEGPQKRSCSRAPELEVRSVSGAPARGARGCIDCHVRRSQPFDLPGIRSADHFVRRRIPPPSTTPFRSWTEPGGPLKLWPDQRLARVLTTPAGKRWQDGLMAMARAQSGHFQQALAGFEHFPAPGSPAAVRPTAPKALPALETWPTFHHLRALALLSARRPAEAEAAFSDALRLRPHDADNLLGRARTSAIRGNFKQAMFDTQRLIEAYPTAEAPWQLRAAIAGRLRRADLRVAGLEAVVKRWPSDGRAWLELAESYRARGDAQAAREAIKRVERLQPALLKENRGARSPAP